MALIPDFIQTFPKYAILNREAGKHVYLKNKGLTIWDNMVK